MLSRGLYIGRFQPVHIGHVSALEYILKREEEAIIAIGSAQRLDADNPFTAGERVEMWKLAIDEHGIDYGRLYIIPFEDRREDASLPFWLKHLCPDFGRVYTNNPYVRILFEDRRIGFQIPVELIPWCRREIYQGKVIRELMLKGDEGWRKLVPEPVALYIDEIGGAERLRALIGLVP